MTLEDAGEDQISHRQRRVERLRRATAHVAQRLFAGPADPTLPSRGRVQAQWQVERLGGGPERLVLGLVIAPVLEGILGDHRAAQAQAGGALQLLDPVLDVVQVDQQYLLGSDFTIARAFPNRVAHQVQTQDGRSASRNAPSRTETWRAECRSEWARARSVPMHG